MFPRGEDNNNKIIYLHIPDYSLHKTPRHHGFNSGPSNYFIPKIDMRNIDCHDPMTWICQIEHFFNLNEVPTLQR